MCLYCQFPSRSMTPQSVRNYVSGAKLLHVITGFDFPFYEDSELILTLRGLDRILITWSLPTDNFNCSGTRWTGNLPITFHHLASLHKSSPSCKALSRQQQKKVPLRLLKQQFTLLVEHHPPPPTTSNNPVRGTVHATLQAIQPVPTKSTQ